MHPANPGEPGSTRSEGGRFAFVVQAPIIVTSLGAVRDGDLS